MAILPLTECMFADIVLHNTDALNKTLNSCHFLALFGGI